MLKYVITPLTLKSLLQKILLPSIRMIGKNINKIFDDKKINKSNFYKNKKLFNIYDIHVDKVLISKKEPCGKKS